MYLEILLLYFPDAENGRMSVPNPSPLNIMYNMDADGKVLGVHAHRVFSMFPLVLPGTFFYSPVVFLPKNVMSLKFKS